MAQAEPVQPAANRGAMDADPMHLMQLKHQRVQRQIAPRLQADLHPVGKRAKLAATGIALRFGQKSVGLALQLDHVVDEFDRNPEMIGRCTVPVALLNKSNNSFT